ncbi:hypothetical protein L7F22_006722 [Adiantum nelumboides]|nr:hypothetical protein [Adiantum nelumboides]
MDGSSFLGCVLPCSPCLSEQKEVVFVSELEAKFFGVFFGGRGRCVHDAHHSHIETSRLSHLLLLYCGLYEEMLTFLGFFFDLFAGVFTHDLHPSFLGFDSAFYGVGHVFGLYLDGLGDGLHEPLIHCFLHLDNSFLHIVNVPKRGDLPLECVDLLPHCISFF